MKSKSNGTRDFRIACTSNSFLLVLCRQISDGRWMDNEKWFQQILMWNLISIYFGCTFITRTFCDTEIYLLNYLCKADTEVTEKIKLDILRSCLSFKSCRQIHLKIFARWLLINSVHGATCLLERADFVFSDQTLQWLWLCFSKASAGHSSQIPGVNGLQMIQIGTNFTASLNHLWAHLWQANFCPVCGGHCSFLPS